MPSLSTASRAMASDSTEQAANRVAVAQMTSTGSFEANFATCSRLAEDATCRGCSMLFLPECCAFIGENAAETVNAGESLTGPKMQRFQELARQKGLWLSLGGFQETGPDPQHIYNCHVVLNSEGGIVTSYRKVHLFDVGVKGGPTLLESNSTEPGHTVVSCESPAGKLGVTVCYDLRFPELYQALAFDHGATILLVPSAFTKTTGAAHWELLLRARAVETQCYVIAAAQAGRHNNKRESYGHALIIDPWGTVVGRLDDPEETGIAVVDLDVELLASVRTRMPMAAHRAKGRNCLGWPEKYPT